MAKLGKRGLRRLLDAAGYSAAGLAVAWRGEEAFRQEVVLALLLVPLALWLGQSNLERLLLVASWLLVMIVEILNTAVEA
ncbi:MAG: diacylglycerol kinase, partial [Gemmatimonadota bacterium]|nr:diacylglycerol kinase [Gemmatimonadota bacterium]